MRSLTVSCSMPRRRSELAATGGSPVLKLDPNVEHHPVVVKQLEKRASDVQLRVADAITTFAGSMNFVYIHGVIFAVWCATGLFGADKFPFNFLTMAVSLEAIFLATFVMIGQNRQAAFQQAKADHDYAEEEMLLTENTDLTKVIHELTKEMHQHLLGTPGSAAGH
jgi:uncharacterized membrane protein